MLFVAQTCIILLLFPLPCTHQFLYYLAIQMSGRGKVQSAKNTSQVYITQSECNNASQVSEAHTLGIFRHKCYCFGFYTYLFPGKSKIQETGCGKFFSREIPSRLCRQFPDFKRVRQALALCDPLICCKSKYIILSLTQRL